jgi:hypothetical protein
MLMVTLLMVLGVGILSLSAIELRRSFRDENAAEARANARMALVEAIGQLQETLGPDRRISATAEILGDQTPNRHWTGVWKTHDEEGKSWMQRDDLEGGLRDRRSEKGYQAADEALAWLVSGGAAPDGLLGGKTVKLAGPSGAEDPADEVVVPLLESVDTAGKVTGHHAWWTGDLGVRANIGTTDPRAGVAADRAAPGTGGLFRVMTSQAADMAMMEGAVALEEGEGGRLVTAASADLTGAGPEWSREHAFDFTVHSRGVLADVAEGGLKRDLTAYLASNGSVPARAGVAGLSDDDSLVGDLVAGLSDDDSLVGDLGAVSLAGGDSRHRNAGPRFGLLRNWAKAAVPFSGSGVAAGLTEFDTRGSAASRAKSLANEQAVRLAGNKIAGLQPILVEATIYSHLSTYRLEGRPRAEWQLRFHHYPRVVMWNPYNVELVSDRVLIMMQGNGRQEMWTESITYTNGNPSGRRTSQWLSFEGGRSTSIIPQGPGGYFDAAGYKDPYIGSYYFSIPKTRFGPGECLVFSPARSAEYDSQSLYRTGPYNLMSNELSCEVAPDPSRSYYVSGSDIGGGVPFQPISFWYAPTPAWSNGGRKGVENQGDDTRAVLKHVGDASTVTFEVFDALPQLSVLSASLQYGAGLEPRIAWSTFERMPMQLLEQFDPKPTQVPNVRTREGIRLRWFREHPSNLLGSGALSSTPHFEEALMANWNPRATFVTRSPWDNVAGSLPSTGNAGGPWFFGAYTRDLFDQAVSWDEQAPVPRGGRFHGNPFGTPQEGADRHVLFDVPRVETGVVSLAQLQHVKLSELVWHPSYAIGNSLADPRLGSGGNVGLNRTAAKALKQATARFGGFHEDELGWSSDIQRSANRAEWATNARSILSEVPATDNLVYDLSFEANRTLWDRFYLSTGTDSQKRLFLQDPEKNPLPNGRMRLASATASEERLKDFHQAASQLLVEGAFNVNSTRVEAWKALLGSSRITGFSDGQNVPFPRVLAPPGSAWKSGSAADSDAAWAGYRELTKDEIGRLAEAIVEQVKLRGPFLSLADFVNRRLAEHETGRMGALQAAIERAGLNFTHNATFPLDNRNPLPDYRHPDNIRDATRMEQTLKPASKAWGAPSYLTQADVLQVIGPALAARSDTFVIRAYGDSVDAAGVVQARAWCEATVQRMPEPLMPDDSGLNPRNAGQAGDYGRRFTMTSFRWLRPGEI